MQLKDYFAVAALLISIISLAVSVRVSHFNKRAKSAELRAALLAKLLEASLTQSRIARHHAAACSIAFELTPQDAYFQLRTMDPGTLSSEITSLYEHMVALSKDASIFSYENYFHEAHRVAVRSKEQEDAMLEIRAKYEKVRASLEERAPAV